MIRNSNIIFSSDGKLADKPKNYLWLGDCLERMVEIPDDSIDAIICDLPYGTTACKWDSVIPFEPLWEQYDRIIKDRGIIILNSAQPFTTKLINSRIDLFRYTLVWNKNKVTAPYLANKRPMVCHEDICIFYKKQPTYNPQKIKRTEAEFKRLAKKPKKTISKNEVYGNFESTYSNRESGEYKHPKSILNIPTMHKIKSIHPTQKPLDLLNWLIKSYTNENDWVLDNTCGSNTTGISCYDLNRNYIGIEKDKDIYEVAKKRMEENILLRANEPKTLFEQ